jgi:hypothetical protein
MTSRTETRPNNRQSPAPLERRPAWRRPELRRMKAGAAENGLTPVNADAAFSQS